MRVRGLKRKGAEVAEQKIKVAPHAGAWIETIFNNAFVCCCSVAPHAGAWIETALHEQRDRRSGRRTPCGCVD